MARREKKDEQQGPEKIAAALAPHVVDIASLQLDPKNVNMHPRESIDAIKYSFAEFGQQKPIVYNPADRTVTAGNGSLQAAMELGWTRIAAVPFDGPPEKIRKFGIADNQTGRISEFDPELLKVELQQFDFPAIKTLQLLDFHLHANPTVEEPVPEPPVVARSKLGDLYALGEHRLLCGDSTKEEDVARLMGKEQAVLMATDPPYGVSYADKNAFLNSIAPGNRIQEPILGDHLKPEQMSELWNASFSTVRKHLAPGASYYVTGPQGGDLLLLLLALRDCGFPLRHMLIWAKNNHVLGRCDYHYKHEPIIFGWVDGPHSFYGESGETSLWEIPRPTESKLHPTMKPIELYLRAMRNSTKVGDVCIEPFAGSGSQIVAAEQAGRRCFAMELDPRYVDVCVGRWERLTGKKARVIR